MALSKRQWFILLSTASAICSIAAVPTKVLSSEPHPGLDEVQQQMNILQAIFLGFVQGMTEFLPISSSAHLKVVPVMLGWGDPGVGFTAIIQLGSIVAVLWYFWDDMTQIIKGAIKAITLKDYESHDFQLFLGIILGTMPIIIFGLLIKRFIPDYDNSPLRSLAAIAIASIFMSLLLGLAEKIGNRQRDFQHLSLKDGLWMGLAQSLALIPGVSRSGSTITGGLFMSLERETAARFSFLLGIPAITIAGLVELKDFLEIGVANVAMVPMVVGVISSGIFSYMAIAGLIQFLKTQSTWVFIWYRLIFGVVILGAISTGLLKNS
ncbi:undecaprenyl-diphosphate phosphatase [Umezakia ovalisporum]|jgi:undecaprenyl-diphosphatase|uniref:Undecaprenyl-diphosphatase n=2 Tax=Umezakia ovalisporum TaxID=75695 RepID=A0AA43GYG7_9CYAN|nr:undecaprenyl-diphosphate phosphatase [Umezakia ovalisporum]MBI1243238.1 undecaprenyl-diphosphate phosphatase [Nostoc sp. RI_552]MDH6057210.1 undecaprenyl-diphosphate phosphatase [Umezakia ovalisporum FSS-43]MDH6063982.1 undecaprenyl-diphosphate phosphatase [Umezakia ovalisporum FSS-62]MDH6067747.1 undecaprenyl-diphosphate phosphatase [Umezakia ovalisporum APH033B]MDH6071883.1 undecaprenyl-diphosphate phosphatase [Umezakia ovalisporum CobakiLakeA]